MAKAYFARTEQVPETVQSTWAKTRGSLLHYVVRSLGWNELKVTMKFALNGKQLTVVGHVDAYDPETITVYDLKTSRFVEWQSRNGFIPRDNHITQVQSYYTLLDSYAIPVSRLVLVYVDDQEILPIEVPLGNRKGWMIQRASTLHTSLTDAKTPEPEVGFDCAYCSFIEFCPAKDTASKFRANRK